MANILEYIENNPEQAQRLVGLKYDQLQQLIQNALITHNQKLAEAEEQKIRIIKGGGGRKVKLSMGEQIILTLIYLRHLTTFQLLGIQFGVSETTANDTFNYWFPLLRELLPSSMLEQVKKTLVTTKLLKKFSQSMN
ncbi:helix-turn-helix domain-containing protein [Scytonema sp. PCC 10023]|uniref:helix-turn-helix domain-containing protein n=1 Tax=Scytonema sp. PCC 10023 TaxID=1680591 RepID=UPI0039C604C5